MKFKHFYAIALFALFLTSCNKDEPVENNQPDLSIQSEGQTVEITPERKQELAQREIPEQKLQELKQDSIYKAETIAKYGMSLNEYSKQKSGNKRLGVQEVLVTWLWNVKDIDGYIYNGTGSGFTWVGTNGGNNWWHANLNWTTSWPTYTDGSGVEWYIIRLCEDYHPYADCNRGSFQWCSNAVEYPAPCDQDVCYIAYTGYMWMKIRKSSGASTPEQVLYFKYGGYNFSDSNWNLYGYENC